MSLGYFDEGASVTVSMTLTADVLYVTPNLHSIYYMDVETAETALEQLAEEQYIIEDGWKEHHFVGTYTTNNDNTTVLTTLPYDEGWKIYLDGKEIDYTITLDALITFEIEDAGEHTLEMKYAPKTFTLGLAISILSAILFTIIVIFEKPLAYIRNTIVEKLSSTEEDNNESETSEEYSKDVASDNPDEKTEE